MLPKSAVLRLFRMARRSVQFIYPFYYITNLGFLQDVFRIFREIFSKSFGFSENFDKLFGAFCEIVASVIGYHYHIFDTATVLAGDVDARLDGDDIA